MERNENKKSRALFFLNGYYGNLKLDISKIKNDDVLIGVDGGLNFLFENGLQNRIDYAIGDFDSFNNPHKYFPENKIIKFEKEKDYTDTLGAFFYIKNHYNKKIKEYHFYGVSGKREDHFLSLIYSFYSFNDLIFFHSLYEDFLLLKKGKYRINIGKGSLFSVFPLKRVKNLSLINTKYSFKKKYINLTGMGVSNETTDDEIVIEFEEGILLISILKNYEEIKEILINNNFLIEKE
ncbi:MAG: thiamine diphosphokinase [Spirochaetes bacterium]|nr:thiamine diphosphokinase [Spirochaetota bacterium]